LILKKYIAIALIFLLSINLWGCALIKKPIDDRTNFSKYLKETEEYLRNEDWEKALASMEKSQEAWSKVKPILQIDIDHDYVNDIENNFTLLKGYIETKEKPASLATILLIQNNWKNIGEM